MKRVGLWAIGIVALASVGPLVEQGYAGEKCGRVHPGDADGALYVCSKRICDH
jgi:hypothetical protein